MTLKTEYLQSGVGQVSDPANEEFAAAFTSSYTTVAERYPIFEELFEYAKLVSLAKYLKEERIPLLWFLLTNRDMVLTENSPETVDAFVTRSRHFRGVSIEGGVDLAVDTSRANYRTDAEATRAVSQLAARPTLASAPSTPRVRERVTFELADVDYSVNPSSDLTLASRSTGPSGFAADLAFWQDGEPGLELVRYHDEARPGQFGEAWHLMVPFQVSPASEERIEIQNVSLPRLMRVTNLLTHSEEILAHDRERYSIEGWVPPDGVSSNTLGLFLMTDGSFRLADRLGGEFRFDPSGRLTGMSLSERYAVDYEYDRVQATRTAFPRDPWRLVRVGGDVEAGGLLLPDGLRLEGADGEAEAFTYDKDPERTHHVYVSERSEVGAERLIALMTDGSFVFTDGTGQRATFGPDGRFRSLASSVVTRMVQGANALDFEYVFDGERFRIASAVATSARPSLHGLRVRYEYDSDGELISVFSPSRGHVFAETP